MQEHPRAIVRRVLSSPSERRLMARMVAWRLLLPVLRRSISLPRLHTLMQAGPAGRTRPLPPPSRILELARLVYRVGSPSAGNCLERSLLAYRYLTAAGERPSLSVGLARENGSISGHAWISVEGTPIGERQDALFRFEEVTRLGPG